jgi:hypothetical protein
VQFTAEFKRELKDSDALHWGEGTVSIGSSAITLVGKLSPGPDYKLYLSPHFVETESDFKRLKSTMIRVGDVKTFHNFVVAVPASIDPAQYSAVIVWCETFSEFIPAAKYRYPTVTPNKSLNRTHCGMRLKARHFILGL